jgi:hypothetical protein
MITLKRRIMSSQSGKYDDTVTVTISMVTVVNTDRFKKSILDYTNLRCDSCKEWWVMLCIGDTKTVTCPWCDAKCEITNL